MDRRGGAVFRAPRTRMYMHTSYMYACVRVRVHMGGGDTIQGKCAEQSIVNPNRVFCGAEIPLRNAPNFLSRQRFCRKVNLIAAAGFVGTHLSQLAFTNCASRSKHL